MKHYNKPDDVTFGYHFRRFLASVVVGLTCVIGIAWTIPTAVYNQLDTNGQAVGLITLAFIAGVFGVYRLVVRLRGF